MGQAVSRLVNLVRIAQAEGHPAAVRLGSFEQLGEVAGEAAPSPATLIPLSRLDYSNLIDPTTARISASTSGRAPAIDSASI